jgi:putative nucleotidyltransferase with HDIG domain
MVRRLTVEVSRRLALSEAEELLVDVCARVRDVGMMTLPDAVVLATASLSPHDWEMLNEHPVAGAELLKSVPVMEPAAGIVRSHHERWDGEGYPDGLRGEAIPLLSRVIAACDAFVAIASDRPYRRGLGAEAALEFVRHERGAQFDPQVVDALEDALTGRTTGAEQAEVPEKAARRSGGGRTSGMGGLDLRSAIGDFDVVPAFEPACERALATIGTGDEGAPSELVAAIESDTGLTVAVLRRGQGRGDRRPVRNVSDAVSTLPPVEIEDVIRSLPRAAFPWNTRIEAMLHHSRVHAQAVARAADRIGREIRLIDNADLLVAALLHDVGKLVLARARPEYPLLDHLSSTPEQRVREERRTLGIDHASVGGLLLERWGLPSQLAKTVAAHHTADAGGEIATLVRLADMVAHHAQTAAVDRRIMLRLAGTCGLPVRTLRDVLFDLPHSGGSRRRRAEASPLSTRETDVLRLLAEGKLYKQIALDLDISISTVRSHLHSTYHKLQVPDRAQAVLRATEMAWI